jgi:hypothetical protein
MNGQHGHGPYQTYTEAMNAADALRDAVHAADAGGTMTEAVRAARRQAAADYLVDGLAAAGVELGAYDRRIAAWLSTWEAETVTVVLGWVQRANAGGYEQGCADAVATVRAARNAAGQAHAAERDGTAS